MDVNNVCRQLLEELEQVDHILEEQVLAIMISILLINSLYFYSQYSSRASP